MDKTQKTYAIGVDLGGTNTVFGIVNAQGDIVAQNSIKTQAYSTAESFVEAGMSCLRPLIDQVGGIDNIAGMGIGAPNANYYTGAIETAPNIAWAHERIVPLAQMFSAQLSTLSLQHGEAKPQTSNLKPQISTPFPVKMTNDANAAAMGEMAYGVARVRSNSSSVRRSPSVA